jgi:hypothetical protein
MIEAYFPELRDVSFTFTRRGTPLPPDRRPIWRISLLVEILSRCSRGRKSSILRLRILDWAARNAVGTRSLIDFVEGKPRQLYAPVRYDPSFLRALSFGNGAKLFSQTKARVELTDTGFRYSKEVVANNIRPLWILPDLR